mgnify:CR=1 FL=1
MKKNIVLLSVMLLSAVVFGQNNEKKVTHVKKGDLVEATYYYADGSIQQVGTFNTDGKLHGTWTSFDNNGKKLAVGNYNNGKKVGKWLFWVDGIVNEVSYVNSKISKIEDTDTGS